MNINELIELDKKNFSLKEIAQMYNCNYQNIQGYFSRNNYKRIAQKDGAIKVNNDFFECIDSEIKAYLLGFFTADGGILNDNRLQICLSEKDEYIIDLFIRFICPLSVKEHYLHTKGAKNRRKQVKIRFTSKKIIKDLIKFNLYYPKSKQEFTFINNVSNDLKWHFIRGYFDGDGCISNYSKNSYLINISNSTKSVLSEIQSCFNELGIYSNLKEKKNHFILTVYKKDSILLIKDRIYHNANYYLERKKNIFDSINTVLTK